MATPIVPGEKRSLALHDQQQQATPEQALDALYQLSRQVHMPSVQHDAMRAARDIVRADLRSLATDDLEPAGD